MCHVPVRVCVNGWGCTMRSIKDNTTKTIDGSPYKAPSEAVCDHLETEIEYSTADTGIVCTVMWLECPDATSVLNSHGDTALDAVVEAVGLTGTVLLVNTGLLSVTPEVAYGLVFDTVGCDAVNFLGSSSLVATTSAYSGCNVAVECAYNVRSCISEDGAYIVDAVGFLIW